VENYYRRTHGNLALLKGDHYRLKLQCLL